MRVVDFHVHAFPDQVAPKAVGQLCETYKLEAHFDGTISGLRRRMAQTVVSASVVVPVATKPEQVRSINDWAARVNSDDIICFGTLHPDLEDLPGEVERILSLGLKGIKVHADFQGARIDDPKMMRVFEAAEGRLIALLHAGQEIEPFPDVMAPPRAIRRVHDVFPDLEMIAAHMGGFRMWDDARQHLVGTNVYLDTSYCPPEDLGDDELRRMILAHGPDKVVFATDGPFGDAEADLARLRRLDLPIGALESILHGNADRLLTTSPAFPSA